jgi:hypothetical protein
MKRKKTYEPPPKQAIRIGANVLLGLSLAWGFMWLFPLHGNWDICRRANEYIDDEFLVTGAYYYAGLGVEKWERSDGTSHYDRQRVLDLIGTVDGSEYRIPAGKLVADYTTSREEILRQVPPGTILPVKYSTRWGASQPVIHNTEGARFFHVAEKRFQQARVACLVPVSIALLLKLASLFLYPLFRPSDEPLNVETLVGGFVKCPRCGVRFSASATDSWDGERHLSCGARLILPEGAHVAASQEEALHGVDEPTGTATAPHMQEHLDRLIEGIDAHEYAQCQISQEQFMKRCFRYSKAAFALGAALTIALTACSRSGQAIATAAFSLIIVAWLLLRVHYATAHCATCKRPMARLKSRYQAPGDDATTYQQRIYRYCAHCSRYFSISGFTIAKRDDSP